MLLKPQKSYSQMFICANNSQDDERKFLNWAENELRLAGLLDGGDPYGGMISNGIMEMLEVWHNQGHSGMSASITRDILNWEHLTPLTNKQEEWQDIEEIMKGGWGDGQKHYQSLRNPACFTDDFKQYYNVNDDARKMYDMQTTNLDAKIKANHICDSCGEEFEYNIDGCPNCGSQDVIELEASEEVKEDKDRTDQEKKDYEYFLFLIDHSICELKEMVKTEKDPHKKAVIEETIADAEARNIKCTVNTDPHSYVNYQGIDYKIRERFTRPHDDRVWLRLRNTSYPSMMRSYDKVTTADQVTEPKYTTVKSAENPPKKDTKKYWKEMALYDNLTDLPNRNAFDLTIEEQKDEFGWISIFDIDHFKKINDEYGHDAGDRALKTLASFLMDRVLIFRFGGEEFVSLLPKSDPEEVEALLNEVREDAKTLVFEDGFNISISIGVAPYDYKKGVDEQFKKADLALYCSKNCGRDMTTMYEPEMDEGICPAHKLDEDGNLVKNDQCIQGEK